MAVLRRLPGSSSLFFPRLKADWFTPRKRERERERENGTWWYILSEEPVYLACRYLICIVPQVVLHTLDAVCAIKSDTLAYRPFLLRTLYIARSDRSIGWSFTDIDVLFHDDVDVNETYDSMCILRDRDWHGVKREIPVSPPLSIDFTLHNKTTSMCEWESGKEYVVVRLKWFCAFGSRTTQCLGRFLGEFLFLLVFRGQICRAENIFLSAFLTVDRRNEDENPRKTSFTPPRSFSQLSHISKALHERTTRVIAGYSVYVDVDRETAQHSRYTRISDGNWWWNSYDKPIEVVGSSVDLTRLSLPRD